MQLVFLVAFAALVSAGVDALSCKPCSDEDKQNCPKISCPGRIDMDVCACCPRCAKQIGNECGGPWWALGECDNGLTCVKTHPEGPHDFKQSEGVCKDLSKTNVETLAVNGCPADRPLVSCMVEPCRTSSCPNHPGASCVNNYCGGCNAKFMIGNTEISHSCHTPTRSRSTNGCQHNGVTYAVGQSFKMDCNSCTCMKGGDAACTKMGCASKVVKPAAPKVNGAVEGSKPTSGCHYKGMDYPVDARFNIDCNRCICRKNGTPSCTRRRCPKVVRPTVPKVGAGTDGSKSTIVCQHKGKTYAVGARFNIECNRCFCTKDGTPACTKKGCHRPSVVKPTAPKVDAGSDGSKSTSGCQHNGVTYTVGQSFKMDCNSCTCNKGGYAACTKMACVPRFVKPTAPKVKAANVVCEGKYEAGESYQVDCNTCICGSNGLSRCTLMDCDASRGCYYNNMKYAVGDSFKKDDCNTCTCARDGSVACTEMACSSRFFGNLFKLFQDRNCSFEGQSYRPNQRFSRDCNSCVCYPGGRVGCTRRGCPTHGFKTRSGCRYGDNWYRTFQTFNDKCNNLCFCAPGGVKRCNDRIKCDTNSIADQRLRFPGFNRKN